MTSSLFHNICETDNFFPVLLFCAIGDTAVGSRPELRFCIDVKQDGCQSVMLFPAMNLRTQSESMFHKLCCIKK